jgi:lipoprotein-anchoring transpeptidase ErfK/SrfK
MEDMRSFKTLGYANVREALAEKFHMSTELLAKLNPDASFAEVGEEIIVANVSKDNKTPSAARIDVDKDRQTVKIYSAMNELIAFFPASVGSEDKPTPSGTLKVTAFNSEPTFRYDPRYLFKEVETQKPFYLQPGPNNPLGLMWIALSKPSYGIHGTPEPSEVGKAASHGCVRLTNWDVQRLFGDADPRRARQLHREAGRSWRIRPCTRKSERPDWLMSTCLDSCSRGPECA